MKMDKMTRVKNNVYLQSMESQNRYPIPMENYSLQQTELYQGVWPGLRRCYYNGKIYYLSRNKNQEKIFY